MATYDSNINWDSGSRWDEADKPKTPKKMAKIKLNIHSKSDNELLAFRTGHSESMDDNANFPTRLSLPPPPPSSH